LAAEVKIIAIDFETANEQRASACSVGLAWIENGAVTRVEERLIRPKQMRFSGFNIGIHGIHPEDVEDAPEFPEVMDEFREDFAGAMMLAHNASFDMSVWRASLDLYRQPYPIFDYLCTLQMARRVWADLPSHKLNALGRHLCIAFEHHNAAADASVCASVALAIATDIGAADIPSIPAQIGMVAGKIHTGGYSPCSCRRQSVARPC
jgi:DNA polymerase-3 subunit epsilon